MNISTLVKCLLIVCAGIGVSSKRFKRQGDRFIANPNNPFLKRPSVQQQQPEHREYPAHQQTQQRDWGSHQQWSNSQKPQTDQWYWPPEQQQPQRDWSSYQPQTQTNHWSGASSTSTGIDRYNPRNTRPQQRTSIGTYISNPNNPFLNKKPLETGQIKLPTPEEGCGPMGNDWKIIGGVTAEMGAYPWLALLGYDNSNGIEFRCGGSLITRRHVITAAHCIKRQLRIVRLGEHDTRTRFDLKHEDYNVELSKPHPQFSRLGVNDIGIIYLSRDVWFTDTIMPICIPKINDIQSRALVGQSPSVAGWGKTKNSGGMSTILQETQLPIIDNDQCKTWYRERNRLAREDQFDKRVICAGDLNGEKDTCDGDSGGPLMLPEKFNSTSSYIKLVGIVSYGIGCAEKNSPGVYTNPSQFSDWIEEVIAETTAS